MKLKSFVKKLFFGYEVLEKIDSPVNGEITVVEDLFGGKEVRVGGVTQSGGLVEKLWRRILNFQIPIFNPRKNFFKIQRGKQFSNSNFQCLILGLGCGTVAKLISEKFPGAKIVGVEIDPLVVELGKKYFDLNEIRNLEVVIRDAAEIVQSSPKDPPAGGSTGQAPFKVQSCDLILVDLYLGEEFPQEAESKDFINGLKKILNDYGLIIFNRLYYNQEHRKKAEEFSEKVRQFFPYVETKKVITNMLIFVSNEPQDKV